MPVRPDGKVWLLRTLDLDTNRRAMSGLVYDDDIDSQYSYTQEVVNSQQVSEGDLVLLRDNDILLGAAIIQEIQKEEIQREKLRCPVCNSAKLYWRPSREDWRCDGACLRPNRISADERSTQEPVRSLEITTSYTAKYAETWSDLSGAMLASEFSALADEGRWNPQNSIVQLNLAKVLELFNRLNISNRQQIDTVELSELALSGFQERLVRRRLGQTQFRAHLIQIYGSTCAFSGRAHLDALDAAHLYSYARTGVHFRNAGLLLRKDLHRLFDKGLITVRDNLMLDLHPHLQETQYASLQNQGLQVEVPRVAREFLHRHREHSLSKLS